MSDAHDYSTLKWVRHELNETVEQARRALEAFAEGGDGTEPITECIQKIHQVSGTLQMLRLYGAGLLAEEMEATAVALRDGAVRARQEAVEALAMSLVKLPDYLERVEAGAPDLPLILLPQLNELRASRDVALLSEVALFAPDLDVRLASQSNEGTPNPKLPDLVRARRATFHKALLGWFRSGDPAHGLAAIGQVLEEIEQAAGTEGVASFFRTGRAFIQGLRDGSIETGGATRQLLGRFDRELRRIVAGGEQALIGLPANELLKNVLYYVAGARSEDALVLETRSRYHLNLIPTSAADFADADGLGPSRELMASVRSAVEADLTEIKDRIDLFIRAEESDISGLEGLETPLRKLADTLGMVGQGELRQRLKQQADRIADCVQSGALPDEQALMSMAADIVFVEVSLENLAGVRKRGAADASGLPAGEFDKLMKSVVAEATVDIQHCKDAVTTFLAAPENPKVLAEVPAHLHAVAGAFRVLDIGAAADLLDRLGSYVSDRLLDAGDAPTDQTLNDFADALTSIEYFMEAISDGRGVQESLLAVGRASLDSLTGNAAADLPVEDVGAGAGEETAPPAGLDEAEAQPSPAVALLDEEVDAARTGEEGATEASGLGEEEVPDEETEDETEDEDEIDSEILDIFVEEARDQVSAIGETLPRWLDNRDDGDALAGLRRSFHTLKGSGRMVGAMAIGELAWSIENMLNRVIDGTLQATSEVADLLNETPALLAHLVECQAQGRSPELDSESVMARAFALADTVVPAPGDTAGAPPPPVADEEEDQEEHEGAPAPISIDPELAEVFASEATSHLESLRQFSEACRSGNAPCAVQDEVVRAFHTLRGSANLAEVPPIAEVSAAMEGYVNALKDRKQEVGEDVGLLERSLVLVEQVLSAINRRGAELPEWQPLVAEIQEKRAALEAAPGPEVKPPAAVKKAAAPADEGYQPLDGDPELIAIFLEESQELFESVERGFHTWQSDPGDATPLSALQRTLHTLKGAARFAGITAVGDLSHAFETLLADVEKGARQASGEVLQLAQSVIDRLAEQIADAGKGVGVRIADDLLAQMGTAEDAAPPSARKTKGEKKKAAMPEVSAHELKPVLEPPAPQPKPSPGPRVQSEQVRVRSDLLDHLVNNAGEVSIFRSRLEQQNSELGHNLSELEQTVRRLKQQLRQLEIETETQILFRYERDQERGGEIRADFDPLELDRFSAMQQISRSLIETVSDLTSITSFMEEERRDTDTLLQQQARVTTDLQEGLLRTRMVPFSQLVPRLHRLVRQTCKTLEKKAELEIWGAEGEIDRRILERIIGPLEHLLRNAVSHGIEPPSRRLKEKKPESGKISMSVSREGTEVVIDIADDGAGIPVDAVRRRAVEKGLLDPNAEVRDADVMRFILEHGFSTADKVTQISGRGVGLDVVVSEVKQIGGSVDLASKAGEGTRFQIRLPLTLAISDALLIKLADEVYAIPHTALEGVIRVAKDELRDCYTGEQEHINYAGQAYDAHYLGTFLKTGHPVLPDQQKWFPVLLVHSGEHRVALQVDEVIGNRQIVVKPVGSQLSTISWLSGGTILADGRVALIVDLIALVRLGVANALTTPETAGVRQIAAEQSRTVMVVDDSITVRKVTGHVLERHGMQVITAKDGVEALAVLQDQQPDIMLLDVEMPRMDGYELARHMRNAEELKDIPIIMITSRTGDKHRKLAHELGVRRYLGKPYQEAELLDNIYSVLAESE